MRRINKHQIIMKIVLLFFCVLLSLFSSSCASVDFMGSVSYQSIRSCAPKEASNINSVPANAEIATQLEIDTNGNLGVTVYNLTDQTMTIDRTRSFYMEAGNQISYYDPTVTTTTTTKVDSRNVNVNVGAAASILGVNSRALNGINVGGGTSVGTASTVYNIDQPIVHIPPHGKTSMGRKFNISLFGVDAIKEMSYYNAVEIPISDLRFRFGICISYSVDQQKTFDNFISEYYVNSWISKHVDRQNKNYYPNNALRRIYQAKPNCLTESAYILYFGRKDTYSPNINFIDYQ